MPASLPPDLLARRRVAWEALCTLFLDTEHTPADLARVAAALAGAGLGADEAERVLRREVGPLLWANLLKPAGAWSGFDLAALEPALVARVGRRRPPLFSGFGWVRREWRAVRAEMERIASCGSGG